MNLDARELEDLFGEAARNEAAAAQARVSAPQAFGLGGGSGTGGNGRRGGGRGHAASRASGLGLDEPVKARGGGRVGGSGGARLFEEDWARAPVGRSPGGGAGGFSAPDSQGGRSGPGGGSASLIACGHAPAVVKLVSFASGATRATATAHYVQRKEVPLETQDGQLLRTPEAVTAELQRWAERFEQRAPSQDAVAVRVAVAGLADSAANRKHLEQTVAGVFAGHLHAHRIAVLQDGSIEARAVLVLAGRGPDARAERFRMVEQRVGQEGDGFSVRRFDAKSHAAMAARAEATGVVPHALSLEPGLPAHGVDGLTQRLNRVAGQGRLQRSDGGEVANASEARSTALAWKQELRSQTPRDTMHLVISAKADADPERFTAAARAWLAEEFADRQYMFAVHTDRAQSNAGHGHIHAHAIVALRSATGEKLHPNRQTFAGWRQGWAQAAQAQGLAIAATGAMERASSQRYGARDKAIVQAADHPRPGREARDLAYAERPANQAMIANARRRIAQARANPIRFPRSEEQRSAANEGLRAWRQVAEAYPENTEAQRMTGRMTLSLMGGHVLMRAEQLTKKYTQEDPAMAVNAQKMEKDYALITEMIGTLGKALPAESKVSFAEKSETYLAILQGRIAVQRQIEAGAERISPELLATLPGTATQRLAQEARAVATQERREAQAARGDVNSNELRRDRANPGMPQERAAQTRVDIALRDRAELERTQAVQAERMARDIQSDPATITGPNANSSEAIQALRDRQEQVLREIEKERLQAQAQRSVRTRPQS